MANSSDAGRSYFANSSKLKIGKKIILTATLTELTKFRNFRLELNNRLTVTQFVRGLALQIVPEFHSFLRSNFFKLGCITLRAI
jgi:hypothetical protein